MIRKGYEGTCHDETDTNYLINLQIGIINWINNQCTNLFLEIYLSYYKYM